MTNMQHYMDDIDDLLEGLNNEMSKRLSRIAKWDKQIAEKEAEVQNHEKIVFDETKSMQERTEAAHKLAELKCDVRDIAEKKTTLAERNHRTVQSVYTKLNELAYHCKLEVEIDNPGCTEQRERVFFQSLDIHPQYLNPNQMINARNMLQNIPTSSTTSRRREYSMMTDDDRDSTRSGTPFNIRDKRKRPGRPRNSIKLANFEKFPHNSNGSSARSSVEPEFAHARAIIAENAQKKKKLSKYMRKKQERLRLEEEQRAKMSFDVKKEIDTGDYESFALSQWNDDVDLTPKMGGASVELGEEDDEQELLDCLLPDFDGLPSPPKGMMEALDVTESGLYSMDMYPPDHKSDNLPVDAAATASENGEFRHPGAVTPIFGERGGGGATSSQSFTHKKANNAHAPAAAAPSYSDSSIEKRTQRTLFGSIADTSFSGRPRKLTDRVTEMILSNREKNKKYRDQEEWCICNGANSNSDMMVECENKNCPIQWFHFDCVGLSESPKDEWFCPDCRQLPNHLRSSSSSRCHD